jgi:Na+/H+ antiporter NhaD/arsenite permease-like protein
MTHGEHKRSGRISVSTAIVVILLLYGVALIAGGPQWGTEQIVAAQAHNDFPSVEHSEDSANAETVVRSSAGKKPSPPLWTVTPFALLLGGIALLPLIPATEHWWESNRNRFFVAIGLSAIVVVYYAFVHRLPLEGHWPAHHVVTPAAGVLQGGFVRAILANAVLGEYIPFIVLLFSLYTISGGIRITGDLQAHPMTNATFMAVGALLASIIGTTGAAMLLIRPLLETNQERKHVAHTVVFFIFIVCNCGGCLLPLGDPPLFLGYLQGVPFLWTFVLWKEWLFVNSLLLAVYLLLDTLWYYRRESIADVERDVERLRKLKFSGWQVNAPMLLGVVLAVAMLDPSKLVPGTNWHPWMYLREIVQLALVAGSLIFGSKQVRYANRFSYGAIIEVAALFIGVFITMQPALQILNVHGSELGIHSPAQFFWATGFLSGVLDNAPTYLVFFQTAQAMPQPADSQLVAGVEHITLVGISLGAVFMGAMTYIGNGPNFMVRTIAEKSGVKMPSFFGFMVYSGAILLPIMALMVWLYLLFPY